MCFDNVFSNDDAIRALAEKTACEKKSATAAKPGATDACAQQHGMVREERMPWGQTLEYAWQDATLRVACHRAYWIAGERLCSVE